MTDFRSWLVLGRVSNLSTVWANGLCAWVLGGGGKPATLAGLLAGLSLLYVGGMYLNDYCDAGFDKQFRPERPIPSGKVKRSTAFIAAVLMLGLGLGTLIWIEAQTLIYGFILLGLIVAYNLLHKHTVLGVPLMAACRAAIYPAIASATVSGINPSVWGASMLMFYYVLGITILARNESTSVKTSAVGYAFLILPMIGALFLAGPPFEVFFPLTFCLPALWMAWTFSQARKTGKLIIGKTIGPLLAGICLIDLAIINSLAVVSFTVMGLLLVFFLLALLAQRYIPAT